MEKLKSRKLVVSIFAAILILVNDKFQLGISQEAIYSAVGMLGLYVVGQGVADHGAQGKKPDIVVAHGEDEGPNWPIMEDDDDDEDKD